MSYELVVIPMTYKEHIKNDHSTCIHCNEEIEIIDEFSNALVEPKSQTEFEGIFSLCPVCFSHHLELTSGIVDFEGPITIVWD